MKQSPAVKNVVTTAHAQNRTAWIVAKEHFFAVLALRSRPAFTITPAWETSAAFYQSDFDVANEEFEM